MKINLDSVIKEIKESWGQVIAEVNEELDAVIEDEMAFSDLGFNGQDIIDSGRLLNSKVVEINEDKAEFSWNPHSPENGYPYAPGVRAGFWAYGKKYIPGRDWPGRAIERVNPVNSLAQKLKKKGFSVKVK